MNTDARATAATPFRASSTCLFSLIRRTFYQAHDAARCEGLPAVEITKAVSIDPGTGEVTIPSAAE